MTALARRSGISLRWIVVLAGASLAAALATPATSQESQAPLHAGLQPERNPPPPQPRKGLGDLLGDGSEARPPARPASGPDPAQGSSDPAGTEGGAARIDAQIARLEAWLASEGKATPASIAPLPDLGSVRDRARELRVLVDRMRSRLYLPDPQADSTMSRRLEALRKRWDDLVRPVIDGQPPPKPLPAGRWNALARDMSRSYCGAEVVAHLAPPAGMPLVGYAWACLSDLFFHELAETEAAVDRSLESRRVAITAELDRRMQLTESRIAEAAADVAAHPSPGLLLRELTWLLHEVELEGVSLRLRELGYQKVAGGGSEAFRWLLGLGPKVSRPAAGSARSVSAFSGSTLTAKLGELEAATKVSESELAALARRLHDAHFTIERQRLAGTDEAARAPAETARARVLAEMAVRAARAK